MDAKKRLKSFEDGFTERKLEGVKTDDISKTLVAFANSLSEGRTGILYIGIENNGAIKGINNPDELQKKIRKIADNKCYPPVKINLEILNENEKRVLAVTIFHSENRPHFAGPAYVRIGSESIEASDQLYDELISTRNSKAGKILSYKGSFVTVRKSSKLSPMDDLFIGPRRYHEKYRIETCNAHYVVLYKLSEGKYIAMSLDNIIISYDVENNRPMIIIEKE